MAEHDDPDDLQDPRVSDAYRGLGKENPPEAIDAAVLAASRRAVRAGPRTAGARVRRWALPVSIAAVVVLTMSLTLRVQLERPDLESAVPAPSAPVAEQARPADEKDAPRVAALEAKEEMRATAKQNLPADVRAKAKPTAKSPVALEPAPSPRTAASARDAGEREQSALVRKAMKTPPARTEARPAAKRAPAPAPAARGFVQEPPAPASSPAEPGAAAPLGAAAAPSAPSATRPDTATGLARQAPAEAAASAGRAESRMSVEDRVQESVAKADKADAELSPREWLERIARLRREGRTKEADESLAAFRRRYPDYVIAKEMRDAVLGDTAR